MLALRHCISIMSSLALLESCARLGGRSGTKDVIPHIIGSIEPKLGDPYDSLTQEFRNAAFCVTGESSKLGSTGASINISQNADIDKIMKEFTGEVRGTPRFIFQEAGAALGYYRSINRNKGAINITYAAKIDAGSERLSQITLKENLKTLTAIELYQNCGDQYVAQINRGGMLTITVSLDFLNEENRSKWQSKLKLTGSWAEIANDLGKKLETSGIDGSLTVNVVQVGGNPSQALLASRSCPLTNVEEFTACKQKVDDLMTYASQSFPAQIDANPAVISYITAPLQNLGIREMPTLTEEVLEARRQLEILKLESDYHSEQLSKAQNISLSFEPQLAASITNNSNLIRETGKTCFTFVIAGTTLDWSACFKEFNALKTRLTALERDNVTVNELQIAADNEIGESIVNPTTRKMSISYVLGPKKPWFLDNNTQVDIDGLSSGGQSSVSQDSLSPNMKRGTLLLRQDQSYSKVPQNGSFDVQPGESVAFVNNEILGQYADNRGTQTVYWRCTNCSSKTPRLATYRIHVKAKDQSGAVFRSRENIAGTYRIMAYGIWRASSRWTPSDARGSLNVCTSGCPSQTEKFQTLIVKNGDLGQGTAIGTEKTISIPPNVPFYFLMNDQLGGYEDNNGSLELILQCQKCDIKSHPIIEDSSEN